MQTDAELNQAVAERVMGWADAMNPIHCMRFDGSIVHEKVDFLSHDWSGVRLVVERMEELGWYLNDLYRCAPSGPCVAGFQRPMKGAPVQAEADTIPRAACLAALKAVGGGE